MAEKNASNSKIVGDTKNEKLEDSYNLLCDDKSALVGKMELFHKIGHALSPEQSNQIKYEKDTVDEMDNAQGDKSLKHQKIVSLTSSVPGSITVKKEATSIEKANKISLSRVSVCTATPIKPVAIGNLQTGEINSDQSRNKTSTDVNNKVEYNIIRLTSKSLSNEERRKLRAKRFNIISAESSQKDKRAITNTVVPNLTLERTSFIKESTPTFNLLKKRAERFGENVSTVMKRLEYKEKLLKRKLKFLESVTNLKELEIKKKRAERFSVVPRV